MSDELLKIEQPLSAEAWWVVAIAANLISEAYYTSTIGDRWSAWQIGESDNTSDVWNEPLDRSLWIVTIQGNGTSTMLQIIAPEAQRDEWLAWLDQINRIVRYAHEQQRRHRKVTAQDVLDEYYLLKRIGRKKTIKQLAEQYGFSENYLYQAKIAYDKTDHWGRNLRHAYKVSKEP